MARTLTDLLPAEQVMDSQGNLKQEVTSLVTDSRRVIPGSVFFALPGLRTNGVYYVEEAIDRGAVAVVTEGKVRKHPRAAFVQVSDVRKVLAGLARGFYNEPDRKLELVGITGTNGKTTVSFLTQYLLEQLDAERKVGMVGTVKYDLGERSLPSFKTTPESVDTYALLQQMGSSGCRQAVMEVSSHGLDQFRVFGVEFDVVVFLNLTRDHLDYHGDLETYFQVKKRLFTGENGHKPKCAVINIEDPWGRRLADELKGEMPVVTFSTQDENADISVESFQCSRQGSTLVPRWEGGEAKVITQLAGRYNISNILAALGVIKALGGDVDKAARSLESFQGVPGRMERIDTKADFSVFIDYAHTDDALDNALSVLREITTGRVITVFGCGGNRDRSKRKMMMEAALRHSDRAVVTSDNPRGEAVEAIFSDMREGVSRPEDVSFVEDRRAAISMALDMAKAGDAVIVAGKGHESMQEFKDRIVPFNDKSVCQELLELKNLVQG